MLNLASPYVCIKKNVLLLGPLNSVLSGLTLSSSRVLTLLPPEADGIFFEILCFLKLQE